MDANQHEWGDANLRELNLAACIRDNLRLNFFSVAVSIRVHSYSFVVQFDLPV